LGRVNSTVHGTTYQIPLKRFQEENLNPLDKVPPYKVVHKETRKISRDCYISFLGNKDSESWVSVIENRKHKNPSTFSPNTEEVLAFSELINNSRTRAKLKYLKI
jgi:hypothetical protein